jgi:hypothetical protein
MPRTGIWVTGNEWNAIPSDLTDKLVGLHSVLLLKLAADRMDLPELAGLLAIRAPSSASQWLCRIHPSFGEPRRRRQGPLIAHRVTVSLWDASRLLTPPVAQLGCASVVPEADDEAHPTCSLCHRHLGHGGA